MNFKKIKEMSDTDCILKKKSLSQEMFFLRFRKKLGQMSKPHLIREYRRDIARIETWVNLKKNKH